MGDNGNIFLLSVFIILEVTVQSSALKEPETVKQLSYISQDGRNRTLFLGVNRVNSTTAQYECNSYFSAVLVSIETLLKDQLAREFLLENSAATVLTAGFKTPDVPYWYWLTTMQPFNYTNWADGHPISSFTCMSVGGGSGRYGWYSVPCSTLLRYCCETL